MIYPGEYPQPLSRVTRVQCPVVAGYITARLQVEGAPVISQSGFVENATKVTLENTGANQVTVQLLGCNDYAAVTRENLGSATTLVPKGRKTLNVNPRHVYLEIKCNAGTSAISAQFDSNLRWSELGFDKTDAYYPPGLFTAKTPLTTAVH